MENEASDIRQRESDPLSAVRLLQSLPYEERQTLQRQCTWRSVPAKTKLIDIDDTRRDVFFNVTGIVAIVSYALSGRQIAFATLEPGSYFGELSAIDGEPRSAAVYTETPCEIASLPPEAFRGLITRHGDIALTVMSNLTAMIRQNNERVMDMATLSAQQRVAAEIDRLARPDAAVTGQRAIYPLPTQAEIAARTGTTRETVARVLGTLREGGIVVTKGRRLTVRDDRRLRAHIRRLTDHTQEPESHRGERPNDASNDLSG